MKCTKISLYVPPNRPQQDVINQMIKERNIALNIEDNETRQLVTDGLSGILDYLYSESIPKNGLIAFSEGREIKVLTPKDTPVTLNSSRCDTEYYKPWI